MIKCKIYLLLIKYLFDPLISNMLIKNTSIGITLTNNMLINNMLVENSHAMKNTVINAIRINNTKSE